MNIHQVYKGKDANRVHNKPRPAKSYHSYRGGRAESSKPRAVRSYQAYRGGGGGALRAVLIVLLCLVLLGGLSFGALLGVVLTGSHDEVVGEPNIMIILGCQVKPWGPSILLQDRLDKALEYLTDHPEVVVVCSGGQGEDEHISEAQCMAEYLIANGVPADKVLLEDRSFNTIQNLEYSYTILKERGYGELMGQVVVVSNGFHLARIRMLFGRVWGGDGTLSTLAAPSSHLPSRLKMYIREPIGLVKSFLFDGRRDLNWTIS